MSEHKKGIIQECNVLTSFINAIAFSTVYFVFSLKFFWDGRTDFDYKLHPTLSMFQIATFTGEDGRLFRLTIVLSLLIGEGLGCKSASLAPSGPLRNSKDNMVSEFCITY